MSFLNSYEHFPSLLFYYKRSSSNIGIDSVPDKYEGEGKGTSADRGNRSRVVLAGVVVMVLVQTYSILPINPCCHENQQDDENNEQEKDIHVN